MNIVERERVEYCMVCVYYTTLHQAEQKASLLPMSYADQLNDSFHNFIKVLGGCIDVKAVNGCITRD